jgi:hypothetical protein
MENFSKIVATIVQSLIYAKYKHWTIRRLGTHEALSDYYSEIEPLVDTLVEIYMMDTFNIVQPKSLDIPPSDDVITYFRGLHNMLKASMIKENDEAIKNVMAEISSSVKRCLFRLKLDEVYAGN